MMIKDNSKFTVSAGNIPSFLIFKYDERGYTDDLSVKLSMYLLKDMFADDILTALRAVHEVTITFYDEDGNTMDSITRSNLSLENYQMTFDWNCEGSCQIIAEFWTGTQEILHG